MKKQELLKICLEIIFCLFCFGCGQGPTSVTEVGQWLVIKNATASGTGMMVNTYENSAVTNSFNVPSGAPVTSDMSVYPGSVGYFAINLTGSGTFDYNFGSVTITGQAANTSFTSSNQTFK